MDGCVSLAQVTKEPLEGQTSHLLEGVVFFEKVCSAGDDLEFFRACQTLKCGTIYVDDRKIQPTDDEKRASLYAWQRRECQIGSSASRNHCPHRVRAIRGGL